MTLIYFLGASVFTTLALFFLTKKAKNKTYIPNKWTV